MRSIYIMLLTLLLSSQALSSENYEIQIKSGISFGKIYKSASSSTASQNLDFGGGVMDLGLINEIGHNLALSGGAGVLLDFINNQVGRQQLNLGIQYHLIGGPRERKIDNPMGEIVSRSTKQLSLLLNGALVNFAFATKDLSYQVSGSTYELKAGVRYRFGNFGLDLLQTIFSISGSNERILATAFDFGLFWLI